LSGNQSGDLVNQPEIELLIVGVILVGFPVYEVCSIVPVGEVDVWKDGTCLILTESDGDN